MTSDPERSVRARSAKFTSAKQRSAAPSPSVTLRIRKRAREAKELASTLEEAVDNVGQFLREQAEHRPYTSVATATGVGYILGGGTPSRLIGLVFGLGSRFAIEMFLREIVGNPEGGGNPRTVAPEPRRSVS